MQISENHPEDRKIEFLTDTYRLWTPAMPGKAELDLGCGNGDYAVQLAKAFPGREIVAADVMVGRLRKVVHRVERMQLAGQVRILRVEARMLVGRMLPDGAFARIHLLCPDPWPKDRHRGHRLLTSDFVKRIHRVLSPEGVFHFSSDDDYYFDAVKALLKESGLFAECAPDPAAAAIRSNFEERWLAEGRHVRHLWCAAAPDVWCGIGH